MIRNARNRLSGVSVAKGLVLVLWAVCLPYAAAVEVDLARELDPPVDRQTYFDTFPDRLKPLWLAALAHRESDLRREVAEQIIRAHRAGMDGTQVFVEPLSEIVSDAKEHRLARLAAARALIELEAKSQSVALAQAAAELGLDGASLIEPSLAAWGNDAMKAAWRERLKQPPPSRRSLILAIRAVKSQTDDRALEALWELLDGNRYANDIEVRIETAFALAEIQTTGNEEKAIRRYRAHSESLAERLLAANLLVRHRGERTEGVLLEMAHDRAPAIAVVALRRLRALDARLPAEVSEPISSSHDTSLRFLSLEFDEAEASTAGVARIAKLLADRHPQIRSLAGDALIRLDVQESLSESVREQSSEVLHGDLPRGIEFAALVLGSLDHEPSADRFLDLLDHEDAEVRVAAAWGLRKLAVGATAEPIFQRVVANAEWLDE
ncbi:MAG: hypothetical protein KDA42_12960, partial [Planctomycetales bacterium]|nr:hypothetical protein [Planctomycetales bacterium]